MTRSILACALLAASALLATSCVRHVPAEVVPVPALGRGYGAAAVAVGAGAVLYATAGGCKIAGCPPDMYCDLGSERCEPLECTLANEAKVCGENTRCNLRTGSCMAF